MSNASILGVLAFKEQEQTNKKTLQNILIYKHTIRYKHNQKIKNEEGQCIEGDVQLMFRMFTTTFYDVGHIRISMEVTFSRDLNEE